MVLILERDRFKVVPRQVKQIDVYVGQMLSLLKWKYFYIEKVLIIGNALETINSGP